MLIIDKKFKVLFNLTAFLAYSFIVVGQVGDYDNCEEFLDSCGEDLMEYYVGNRTCNRWLGSCSFESGILYRFGSVNIGGEVSGTTGLVQPTCVPSGYLLSVNDGIVCNDIFVQLCKDGSWCDYVFAKDYELMPINRLSEFISSNNHLPGVPSENQLKEEGGLELREIKMLQQEKLEEFYLYLIELDSKVTQLEEKVKRKKESLISVRKSK